jgi:hypothetical protein
VIRRVVAALAVIGAVACGGGSQPNEKPAPEAPKAQPLPTAGISGQDVAVYPLTMLITAEELHWDTLLGKHKDALAHADSLLGALLVERSPEVTWALPAKLRRAAEQAPGMLTNPDQMATSLLRGSLMDQIPDPLRAQMRQLTAIVNARYALVPASLLFVKAPSGLGRAELTLVMADVRTGLIGYRTVATAEAADPWTALRLAIKSLVPGLP